MYEGCVTRSSLFENQSRWNLRWICRELESIRWRKIEAWESEKFHRRKWKMWVTQSTSPPIFINFSVFNFWRLCRRFFHFSSSFRLLSSLISFTSFKVETFLNLHLFFIIPQKDLRNLNYLLSYVTSHFISPLKRNNKRLEQSSRMIKKNWIFMNVIFLCKSMTFHIPFCL